VSRGDLSERAGGAALAPRHLGPNDRGDLGAEQFDREHDVAVLDVADGQLEHRPLVAEDRAVVQDWRSKPWPLVMANWR
jgi:hypothetical protein